MKVVELFPRLSQDGRKGGSTGTVVHRSEKTIQFSCDGLSSPETATCFTWHQSCNNYTALQPLWWIFGTRCVRLQSLIQSHIWWLGSREQRCSCHREALRAHLGVRCSTSVHINKQTWTWSEGLALVVLAYLNCSPLKTACWHCRWLYVTKIAVLRVCVYVHVLFLSLRACAVLCS